MRKGQGIQAKEFNECFSILRGDAVFRSDLGAAQDRRYFVDLPRDQEE